MFKNLTVFQFDPNNLDNHEVINQVLGDKDTALQLLDAHEPTDPVAEQIQRSGFASLDPLVVELATDGISPNRYLPLTMVTRLRAIDNGAVDLAVRRKIADITVNQKRQVGKKEKASIKDEILFEMIPKAPIKEKRTIGFVKANGLILVDAVGKAAEDYISFLRSSVGKLAAKQVDIAIPADEVMDVVPTSELIHKYVIKSMLNEFEDLLGEKDQYKYDFSGSFAFMKDKEQISFKNVTDTTMNGEMFAHVRTGQVMWCNFDNKDVEFRLMSDLSLKALKFVDLGFEDQKDQNASVAQHRFEIKTYIDLLNSIVAEINKANDSAESGDANE